MRSGPGLTQGLVPVEWLKSDWGMSPAPPMPPSVAILLYLARKYEAPDHWYPRTCRPEPVWTSTCRGSTQPSG